LYVRSCGIASFEVVIRVYVHLIADCNKMIENAWKCLEMTGIDRTRLDVHKNSTQLIYKHSDIS